MITGLHIKQTEAKLTRAIFYLQLMEASKKQYRSYMRDSLAWQNDPDDTFTGLSRFYAKQADRAKKLHNYILERYNNCVAESLIIAPYINNI